MNESTAVFIIIFEWLHRTKNILMHLLQFHFDGDGFSSAFRTAHGSILAAPLPSSVVFPTIRSQRVCFSAVTPAQFVSSLSSAGNKSPSGGSPTTALAAGTYGGNISHSREQRVAPTRSGRGAALFGFVITDRETSVTLGRRL